MIVAPGTAASAAAFTFSAVVPVSSVSPGPCAIFAGSGALLGAVAAAPAVPDVPDPPDPPVAAPARAAPPMAAPTAAAHTMAPTLSRLGRRAGVVCDSMSGSLLSDLGDVRNWRFSDVASANRSSAHSAAPVEEPTGNQVRAVEEPRIGSFAARNVGRVRFESAVTSVSWIPSAAISGVTKTPFELGITHYDDPPPELLADLDAVVGPDGARFA